jgi:hypothetical protein
MDELHRLQLIWLQRADRLERTAAAPIAAPVTSGATENAKARPSSVAKSVRTPSPQTSKPARKLTSTVSRKPTLSAKLPTKTAASGKRPAAEHEVTVVPTSHDIAGSERLAKARKKAELRTIRQELDDIAGRLECLSRSCPSRQD